MSNLKVRYGADNSAWKGGKQTYQCAHCGAEFQDHPSNRAGHALYFCGRACQAAWQAEARTGANSPSWKGGRPVARCEQCGKEYETDASQLRRYAHTFCSRACKYQWLAQHKRGEGSPTWKGGPLQLVCAECGKTFERNRRSVRPGSRAFCDRKCKGAWAAKNLVGPNAPRWRGGKAEYYGPNWMAQARAARKRDNHQCRICGSSKGQKGKALDVHHIRPFKAFGYVYSENDHYIAANDLANLITLCPVCHKAVETGTLQIQ